MDVSSVRLPAMVEKPPPLKVAPRSKVAADAADVELATLDLRDHPDPTAKTELMAQPALQAIQALMAHQSSVLIQRNPAKSVLLLPVAHPAVLDPRDHPDPPDPLEMMLLVARVARPALLDLLVQQAHLAHPDRKDQTALPDQSLKQLEPQAPTALLVLQALLDPMDLLAQQATLAPQAQLAHLATLEPVLHLARMVDLAKRDPKVHLVEAAAATTAHHHALHPAIKPRHPATTVLMMFMISYIPLVFS